MPKLYTTKQVEKVLLKKSFSFTSQKSSHLKYTNSKGRVVIVPANQKVVAIGTFKKILKMAHLKQSEFENLLK